MRPLRIAFVAPSLSILGGQAVQADRLLRAWRDDPEVEAYLVPVNPPLPGVLRHAARVKYVRTAATELTYLPSLVRELPQADVVHVFSASYTSFLLAPLPAILAARLLGKPVVLNYRSGEAPDHLRRSAIARKSIAAVDRNVVPSRYLLEVFRGFGIDTTVVPNIVDLDRFRFRERAPLRPRLLSTRNFDVHYDVGCTLRAFRLVQDRFPDASLTLVGGGPEEPRLRALARNLRLANLTFAGRVVPDAIPACYAAHDIYLQTPKLDNMPTSVIEAFASGLPVVSTKAGGIPAILAHGEHGLLAPVEDHRQVAAHVISLLDDPARAIRLARAAHSTCAAYTWSAVRQQWLAVYRGVLHRSVAAATLRHDAA